jgi:hypothetical protein
VDDKTRDALTAWKTAKLRCPVIFQARAKQRKGEAGWPTIKQQGFFFHDELRDTKPRVFVRDFTSPDNLLPDGKPPLIVVGTAYPWYDKIGIYSGIAQSLHSVGRFDPNHLIGKSWDELTPLQRSNFRVVAALAEVESNGVFDGINAYDSCVLSAGPFQFTAFPTTALGGTGLGAAEFGALLAFWATRGTSEYPVFRDSLGVAPGKPWSIGLFDTDHRTYANDIRFAASNGTFVAPTAVPQRDYIRTYYAFYRVQAALRFATSLKSSLWPYARQRVADVLSADWQTEAPPGATKVAHVFKSELSIALLVRWHIFRPGHVISGGKAATVPQQIVKTAKLEKKPIDTWDAKDELKLVDAFKKVHVATLRGKSALSLKTTLGVVSNWAKWPEAGLEEGTPSLTTSRDFSLDLSELPFPPPPGAIA